ncbi:MAG: poly-beta-1,6-N-acetyl-D-glucosamine N-deacetylase PgaB [Thermodesulfobacteriota bacterium]
MLAFCGGLSNVTIFEGCILLRFSCGDYAGKGPGPRFGAALIGVFILLLVTLCGAPRASGGQSYFNDKPYFTDLGQLNYATFLMREGDYRLAAREFARLIESFPASPLLPRAQYGMAEAYYEAGRLHDAEEELKLFISNFKDNPFAERARLRLKEVRRKLGRDDNGPERKGPGIYRRAPWTPGPPGLRAVQVMLFEGRTYEQTGAELKRLREAGVDTVIVRVFHNPGDRYYPFVRSRVPAGVYFSTDKAPVVEDILGRVASLAHENGLKIFAWMTTRYADYGVEGSRELACKGYDLDTRAIVRCRGLDLFNEKAVQRLEGLYSDLASYDIDGILFQDDLVLRHTEGFGPYMGALYREETGAGMDPEELYLRGPEPGRVHYTERFWEWASWKNRRLLTVANRLREVVNEKRPGVRFAINLMYESVTNPPYALAWLSQNLEAAVASGFDYYSIMAYHRQMGTELEKGPEEIRALIGRMVVDASEAVADPQSVLMKLQTIDWATGEPLSNGEVVGLLRQIRDSRNVSLAVVPYRGDFPFYELGSSDIASLD